MVVQHVVKQNQIFQVMMLTLVKKNHLLTFQHHLMIKWKQRHCWIYTLDVAAMSTGLCMGAALSGIKLCTVSFLLNVLGLSLAEMTNINIIALCRNGL
jgi:hypothetical protein